jgi:hypothetical protein
MVMADTVVARLIADYPAAGDPQLAAGMTAYLRHQFPFLGIQSVPRRRLAAGILAGLPAPGADDLRAVATASPPPAATA